MGFLRKLFLHIAVLLGILIVSGCARSIIIQEILAHREGVFMFGTNETRDFSIEENLGDSLKLAWEANTHGSYSNTSVTIYDKYIFVPDLSGRISCFELNSGKIVGAEKYKGSVSIAPVLYRFRLFYLVNEYKETYSSLFYYDYFTATKISELRIDENCNNEMIKTEKGIILLGDMGTVYLINYIGQIEWKLETKTLTQSTPALSGSTLIFGNSLGEIVGIDIDNQKILYRINIGIPFQSGFTIEGNRAYAGDNAGNLYSFLLSSGEVLWKFNTGAKIKTIPVLQREKIVIGNLAGRLYCLNSMDGTLIWKTELGGLLNATPLVFQDYIIQPDLNKKVHIVDLQSGKLSRSILFEGRVKFSPVYFQKKIFFGIDQGEILAYDIVRD